MKLEDRRRRIRRLKKWMRPLPRRSNIHRYPVLKWFSGMARRRVFLWSFRSREMVTALFLGLIVAFMPLVGIQMLIVFFLALWFRANLPVIVALQWVSNPFTMGPIYFADYQIGLAMMELFSIAPEPNPLLQPDYDWAHFELRDLGALLDTFPPMMLGGLALGSFIGLVVSVAYKWLAKWSKGPYASLGTDN
ncbi:MAG: DUF2062 domain-containing protein [Opitutae bacterium]|nr:DUF2062 domain-containing protein [Opitutae bacterium]MBT4666244.1 DUF2062 domain-containing protein [Opitutae bacterium]MBT5908651.1 DUF2062 domain-containing protein [Opitutae bacterium]MBT7742943.1 DUF2062 domain-containing protein [Opitutae bacterium]MBT7925170.1 DUF2062 domain-containing protein [Opitutae bacterium]